MTERVRVLLGDGDGTVRQIMRRLLEEDGRFTVVADAGAGAEIVAAIDGADLVVIALRLDDTDGLALLSDIRERSASLPVVILTSFAVPYLRDEARARGCTDYIDKSEPPERILDRLAAAAGAPHPVG